MGSGCSWLGSRGAVCMLAASPALMCACSFPYSYQATLVQCLVVIDIKELLDELFKSAEDSPRRVHTCCRGENTVHVASV